MENGWGYVGSPAVAESTTGRKRVDDCLRLLDLFKEDVRHQIRFTQLSGEESYALDSERIRIELEQDAAKTKWIKSEKSRERERERVRLDLYNTKLELDRVSRELEQVTNK
jgi:hypothetical protein